MQLLIDKLEVANIGVQTGGIVDLDAPAVKVDLKDLLELFVMELQLTGDNSPVTFDVVKGHRSFRFVYSPDKIDIIKKAVMTLDRLA